MYDIRQELRHARIKAGMSQQALATASGVHWTTISRIERGEIAPSWTILNRLANSLRLSIFLAEKQPESLSEPSAEPSADAAKTGGDP